MVRLAAVGLGGASFFFEGSGGRRFLSAVLVVLAALALTSVPASAELRRTTLTSEFGPDGTSATSFPGEVLQIDFNEADDQLLVMTNEPREIFTFDVEGPGEFTPVPGGHFPVGGSGPFYRFGMAVAPFTGNVYVASPGGLYGYNRTGTLLPNFPVTGFSLTADFPTPGEICGVSVNSEGDLIVAEGNHYRLEILESDGDPIRGFEAGEACRVQVDRANDDIYIAGEYAVNRLLYNHDYGTFFPDNVYIGGQDFSDLAIDPVTRHVLGAANPSYNGTHQYQEYSRDVQEGGVINSIDFGSPIAGVAAASDGTAFLGVGYKVAEIPLAGIPSVETLEPIGASEASGFVDPAGEGSITDCYIQWGESAEYWLNTNQTPCDQATPFSSAQTVSATLPALTPGQTYHYRVVAGNANYGGYDYGVDETITPPLVADLKTGAATNVTRDSGMLSGSFNGNGSDATYYFEWGQFPCCLGNNAPASPVDIGTPAGHTPVSASLTDLSPGATYYYRVVVTNSAGTSKGLIKSFTTQGYVVGTMTKPVTGLSQESVTLNGEFFGTGEPVEYYFEWGPTDAYGSKLPQGPAQAGEPTGPMPVSAQLTEFEGSGTYHYRLVASNSLGTSYGQDETFTALPSPVPTIDNTSVSSVEPQSASFRAEITPNRRATIYLFEFGPTTAYGSITPEGGPISGIPNESQSVGIDVDELAPGTLYHYRAVATNFAGTTYGEDRTFLTPGPPAVDEASVSAVSPTSADVSALVRPNLRDTAVRFEFGTANTYGSSTAESVLTVGDGGQHVSGATLTGLTPGTTYHFRAVATSALGSATSGDRTFTTKPAGPGPSPPPPSATKKCKRGFVKRHRRCVKKRHHRKHHKARR